jgi:hypothetical protein
MESFHRLVRSRVSWPLLALSLSTLPSSWVMALSPSPDDPAPVVVTTLPVAPESVSIPTSVPNPKVNAYPVRQLSMSFKEMGQGSFMALRGVESEGAVGFGVRRDELVESAKLKLVFTFSPSLLPALSHLKILFNEELLQTVALDKDHLGSAQTVELNIDPRYFTDYNRLRFQFVGHYTMECELPTHTSLWATISNESRLNLSLRQVPLSNDLAVLPLPFFDRRDTKPIELPFVYGHAPSQGLLKAAGSVAGWMGVLAAYRGHHFPVLDNQLPARHAVVLATNDNRPDFLKNLPPVTQPTLSMIAHPDVVGAKLLLVLGKDDAQVQLAADALALGKASLSGQTIQVTSLQYPPNRQPYDAPRWLTSQKPVTLGELVQNPTDLQLSGLALNGVVNVPARLAPDLFTWNTKGIPLNLTYRYTPNSVSEHGAMNVAVNDVFVRSFPLQSRDAQDKSTASLLMPLLSDGRFQVQEDLAVPAFFPGDNRLQLSFQIPQPDVGRCNSVQPTLLHAVVDPESNIDLTSYHHYIAMPNLAAFGGSGFPFTRYADLSQTSVVLPKQPTTAEIEAYLTALGRMGASTGYPGTRFRLLDASQIAQAKGTDILVVGQADRDGLLASWGQALPTLIEAGKRSVQPLTTAMTHWADFFTPASDQQAIAASGLTTLQGDGPLAAMVGFESPLDVGRSVVALTATDSKAMGEISRGLSDSGKASQMQGDLSFLREDNMESFRTQAPYFVGDLAWWQRLWFRLHSHPVWIALFGIVVGLLLTFMVYGALRAMARSRLQPDHG